MEMPITSKLIELIQDVEEGRRPQSEETADELLAVALELMELGVGADRSCERCSTRAAFVFVNVT